MTKLSKDGKFIIDIDEKYLGEGFDGRGDIATIKLRTKEQSVSLEDLTEVIIDCTIDDSNLINREKFKQLEIYVEIRKSPEFSVVYRYKICNYCSASEVLLAIARKTRI